MSQPPIERPWDQPSRPVPPPPATPASTPQPGPPPTPRPSADLPGRKIMLGVFAGAAGLGFIGIIIVVLAAAMVSTGGAQHDRDGAAPPSAQQDDRADADAAACALLGPMLDKVSGGMLLGDAMATIPNGWPNGQPSAEVRGVFNMFRSAAAAEQNYIDGAGTFEEATSAFQEAVTAYNTICR